MVDQRQGEKEEIGMDSQPDSKHVLFSASLGGTRDLGLNPGWATLEEEMATHSSIPVWKISWTEEPSRLQSVGSQRVGHD